MGFLHPMQGARATPGHAKVEGTNLGVGQDTREDQKQLWVQAPLKARQGFRKGLTILESIVLPMALLQTAVSSMRGEGLSGLLSGGSRWPGHALVQGLGT